MVSEQSGFKRLDSSFVLLLGQNGVTSQEYELYLKWAKLKILGECAYIKTSSRFLKSQIEQRMREKILSAIQETNPEVKFLSLVTVDKIILNDINGIHEYLKGNKSLKVSPPPECGNLRELREFFGKSQQEFADILGVELKTYQAWESKSDLVPSKPARRILEFLKIEPSLLEHVLVEDEAIKDAEKYVDVILRMAKDVLTKTFKFEGNAINWEYTKSLNHKRSAIWNRRNNKVLDDLPIEILASVEVNQDNNQHLVNPENNMKLESDTVIVVVQAFLLKRKLMRSQYVRRKIESYKSNETLNVDPFIDMMMKYKKENNLECSDLINGNQIMFYKPLESFLVEASSPLKDIQISEFHMWFQDSASKLKKMVDDCFGPIFD